MESTWKTEAEFLVDRGHEFFVADVRDYNYQAGAYDPLPCVFKLPDGEKPRNTFADLLEKPMEEWPVRVVTLVPTRRSVHQ